MLSTSDYRMLEEVRRIALEKYFRLSWGVHRDDFGNVWQNKARVVEIDDPRLYSFESYERFAEQLRLDSRGFPEPVRKSNKIDARIRARALLDSQLTEQQREDLRCGGEFQVFTGKGLARRRFWITNTGHNYNVRGWFFRYCLYARASVPVEDETLTRKLLIESDPDAFFGRANREFRDWVGAVMSAIAGVGVFFIVGSVFYCLYKVATS